MDELDPEVYARAGDLFDELCELADADRAVALARAEDEDPRAAALARGMLARDAAASPLGLDTPPAGEAADADERDPAGVLGTSIGDYRIEALLGRGGMGAVYLARRRDPEARVAIKFITLTAAPATAIARFEAEARLLARIDHPGVVRYRDSGVDDRGRPYLAMDLVDGEPLVPSLFPHADDVPRAVAVVAKVAQAVHHLHQRRVLHRDLKPSNIHVDRRGNELAPIVLDLGIARTLADPDDPVETAALTGTFGLGPVGTPTFMAPEQARVDGEPDVRTDVHALGAVLYSLLTGHPPRDLDTAATRDPLEFHRRLQESEARAPSQAVDADLFGASAPRRARRIDRDLDAVVLKALALRPDDRYGSAEAFAEDLTSWRDGLAVSARLVGPMGKLRRLVRRRPVESAIAAVVSLLLIVALVATLRSRAGEEAAQGRYREQLAVSRELNRFFAEDVLLRAMPELDGPEMPVIEMLRSAASSTGYLLEEYPVVGVTVAGTLLDVFERLGASQEADEQLALAEPVANSLPPRDPHRLRFEVQHAILLTRRERWEEAESAFGVLLERLEGMPQPPPDVQARALNGLGYVCLSTGESSRAEPLFERAVAVFNTMTGSRRSGLWEVMGNQAVTAWDLGDRRGAAERFDELLVAFQDQYGSGSVFEMSVRANLAGLHLDRQDPAAALEHARAALALADVHFDAAHPNRMVCANNLASCLSALGQFDEATEMRREVAEGRLAYFGPDDSSYGTALNNLASTLVRAGRAVEALEPAEEAVATLLATLGDAHPTTAHAFLTLAVAQEETGDPVAARAGYEGAIEIFDRAEGDQAAGLASARRRLEALR